jgi:F-type H+-transporting ATPase subunit delta
VTLRGSATRYARALFDVAQHEQVDPVAVHQELIAFNALVSGHESLQRALTNPAVPSAKKRAVVDALFESGGRPNPILARLLLMLAERDRLALLPDLVLAFDRRMMEHRQVVRAQLATAVELPADRVAALTDGLAQATGREVQIETRVDPSLVGGAVAQIGSTVYDGSVITQLQKLKQTLIASPQ